MASDLVGKKMAIGVLFDTVTTEIICGDDYAAQILYDDIVERVQSGQVVSLSLGGPAVARPDCSAT